MYLVKKTTSSDYDYEEGSFRDRNTSFWTSMPGVPRKPFCSIRVQQERQHRKAMLRLTRRLIASAEGFEVPALASAGHVEPTNSSLMV